MAHNVNTIVPAFVADEEASGSFRFEYIRIEQCNRPLPWGEHAQWIPAVDIFGNERLVALEVHVPGVLPEEVQVTFGSSWVRFEGVRKDIEILGRREFFHVEIARGHFLRVVTLPDGLDTQKSEITFELGVLRIVIPWISREWAVACRKVRFPEEWS